ncbi:hypothetical protein B0H98_101556 [Vreelandella songnenensis]|uniref:Pentapeptide MXKDX repeat protein n=1 Tax=Vreelandella songnenensis TaxID=1176243 RepID=A0A2T0V8P3_9GAMM|nr:hypothetical protein [Halomonas songnenensis]PRY66562.1 hypothetical protein B0H98_101556 [Halomonas songnenensis]
MKRMLLITFIGATCTGLSLGAFANSASHHDSQSAQQEDTTAGQLRSIDDSANSDHESGNNDSHDHQNDKNSRDTGSQGPQQGQDGSDLDMEDQSSMNRELQEEQRGAGNSNTRD